MAKKATKPLHLQKQKAKATNSSNESSFGQKQSSDAWFSEQDGTTAHEEEERHCSSSSSSSWNNLKKNLIEFHDTKDTINLKTLVQFWNHSGGLTSLGATKLTFDHVEKLYAMARAAMDPSLCDYHGAQVMILAAGLLNQVFVCQFGEIVEFMEKKDHGNDEASYEEGLVKFSFCAAVNNATKSPETMRRYLEELNIQELKSELAFAEPTIDVVFRQHSDLVAGEVTDRKVQGSLINSLTALLKHGGVSKISSVRVKHNGTRLFLSGSGKKSLSDLGIVGNDIIEIEDIDATSAASNCMDITNLNASPRGHGYATTSSANRSKRKGKKKGKGKK